ncbi:MAG TPA: phytanoyl-CoA dioxygenase family protein [Iamia sp.]|nr:phytanoyl-CoA dioxygenase family protein [Iamia sp.]
MSFDVRTRTDGEADLREPAAIRDALAAALAAAADRLRPALSHAKHPLTVDVEGDTWHLARHGDAIALSAGAASEGLRLGLTGDQLADLWCDLATPMTWLSGGTLVLDGRFEHLLDWWVLVRGAIDRRAPHVAGAVDLGGVDLTRSFTLDDRDDDIRAFLATAGFVHLRGVYGEDEMAAVSADMDAAAPTYEKGDGRSWWAQTSDGVDRLVRMQGADTVCPSIGRIVEDERLARIGAIPGDGHEWGTRTDNRIEALFKPIGVVQGISDVPWHKDCSLGRHSYECSSLTVGISVTGADATSGQLRVVAGSHRALVWPALLRRDDDLPIVDLPTRTGDVTAHLSCTNHMAQPPVDGERRVLYTGFRLPPPNPEATRVARHRLGQVREAAHLTVSQPASSVSRS